MLCAEILAAGGALLSEYRPAVEPIRNNFRDRIRVQTGLAAAVLLTQATADDGALQAARYAAEQDRPLFCTKPGPGPEDEGLRLLLQTPAELLHERLPTFARAKALRARLGERPLATPLDPRDHDAVRAALGALLRTQPGTAAGGWPRLPRS